MQQIGVRRLVQIELQILIDMQNRDIKESNDQCGKRQQVNDQLPLNPGLDQIFLFKNRE